MLRVSVWESADPRQGVIVGKSGRCVSRALTPRAALSAVTAVVVGCLVCACTPEDPAPESTPASSSNLDPTTTPSPLATDDPASDDDPQVGHSDAGAASKGGPSKGELARAAHIFSRLPDRQLVGQLFVAGYRGAEAPVDLVRRYHLGGVITMPRNVVSVAGVAAANEELQTSSHRPWPLVISVDQEGGTVARLGAPLTEFPTYMSLGAADDPELAEQVAHASGVELRAAGFTMVFAPDADVTIGPKDPTIRSRSAGSRPDLVARTVSASLEGYQRSGIVAVAKHFPGHGSVTSNSHVELPHQDATLRKLRSRDLVPFERAVDSGVSAVMVGHISLDRVDRGVPADLSVPVTRLLTHGLGFHGVVTTDALNMAAVVKEYDPAEAAVAALRAGADLLLLPPNLPRSYEGVLGALRSGELSRARLESSAAKIGALMLHESRQPKPRKTVWGTHSRLSRRESAAAITVAAGACSGPYAGDSVRIVGEDWLVQRFEEAAGFAGLATGSGPVVALMTSGAPRRRVDIGVSVASPYVLAAARGAGTRLAIFGWTREAMTALVRVLTGAADPHGRLPVDIPGLTPPICP
jgi:beta-N-acetylhexosaminidase